MREFYSILFFSPGSDGGSCMGTYERGKLEITVLSVLTIKIESRRSRLKAYLRLNIQ